MDTMTENSTESTESILEKYRDALYEKKKAELNSLAKMTEIEIQITRDRLSLYPAIQEAKTITAARKHFARFLKVCDLLEKAKKLDRAGLPCGKAYADWANASWINARKAPPNC